MTRKRWCSPACVTCAVYILIEAFRLSFAQTGPGTVTALSPVTVTSNSVVLSWNQPPTQVDGYEVRLSRGSSLVFVSRFELSPADKNRTTLFYGLDSLMAGVTYNFSVAAIAGSQTGSFVSVLFTTLPVTQSPTPSTPTTPVASNITGPSQLLVLPLSDTSVLLLWSPVLQYVPGGEYRVRVSSGNSTGAFVYVGLALSYIFSNLDPTQNKTFAVQWCTTRSTCSASTTSFQLATAPILPAVTNVTVTSITTSSVNVSWTLEDTDGVDGFQVSWCVTTSCAARLNDITAQTFMVIQYLQDFTNYTIFVCTYQDQQYKTFVGPCVNVTVRTRPAPPPGPVALPLSQTSIIVLWGPKPSCPSISSYRIRIVAVGNTTAFQYTEQLSYTYRNLQPTTKYMFQLEWCPLQGICSDPVDVRGSTV